MWWSSASITYAIRKIFYTHRSYGRTGWTALTFTHSAGITLNGSYVWMENVPPGLTIICLNFNLQRSVSSTNRFGLATTWTPQRDRCSSNRKSVMPAVWVWMLLAVMNLTLGQSISDHADNEVSKPIPEYYGRAQQEPRRSSCKKCYPYLYPKDKYYVLPKRTGERKRHNVVFLVKDRRTGRPVKVAFRNGLKNSRNVRVLKAFNNNNDPCRAKTGRCVYRLFNRKTFRTYKADFRTGRKNGKKATVLKLIP